MRSKQVWLVLLVTVVLTLPADSSLSPTTLSLPLTREVEHRVTNYVTEATLIPWRPIGLLKGETRTLELEFWPMQPAQRLAFGEFRELMRTTPSPLAGKMATIEVTASYPGSVTP